MKKDEVKEIAGVLVAWNRKEIDADTAVNMIWKLMKESSDGDILTEAWQEAEGVTPS